MTLPGPLLDYRQGFTRGYKSAERLGRAALSFAATQALAGILLAASGRFPEKRGL